MLNWLGSNSRRLVGQKPARSASGPAARRLLQALEERTGPTVSLFDGNNNFVRNYAGAGADDGWLRRG
jgi:hypothetical protein